ncbi:MAG TPA: hypothetical protein VGI81_01095 [Tepidisphaeraceae bacterium]
MGVIVLAIAMGIPTIKYLTGSKSEQSAQNAVAAMLARARSDAVALQQPQGVMFVIDAATDRVMLYQVVQSPTLTTDPAGITYLDLTPDRDPLLLPPGVRAWTILDPFTPSGSFKDPFPQYRYLGFNNDTSSGVLGPYSSNAVTDKAMLGGMILFDAQGNLLATPYGFRYLVTTVNSSGVAVTVPSALSGVLFTSVTGTAPALPPGTPNLWPTAANIYLRSQIGLVLVDKDTFQAQQTTATNKDGNDKTAGAEPKIDGWLDQNTTPLLVNRYNGTLTRAE